MANNPKLPTCVLRTGLVVEHSLADQNSMFRGVSEHEVAKHGEEEDEPDTDVERRPTPAACRLRACAHGFLEETAG